MLNPPLSTRLAPAEARFALDTGTRWRDTWQLALAGPPTLEARCPLRHLIIGAYRPNDCARLLALALLLFGPPLLARAATALHNDWMYYIELIISIFSCRATGLS